VSLEAAIQNRGTGHAGLTALIAGRFYSDFADQEGDTPYVVYQRISTVRNHVFGGTATLATSRVQFDSMAPTKAAAMAVAAQVKDAFYRWQGTYASQEILDSLIEDEKDFTEMFDTETELRRVSQDFIISYRE